MRLHLSAALAILLALAACGPETDRFEEVVTSTDRQPLPTLPSVTATATPTPVESPTPVPTPPAPTGAVLVRVLTKGGVPLPNVDVVASWQQFVVDRAVTDADGWTAVAVVEGSDVSAYYRSGTYRGWATVASVMPGELIRVSVVSFAPDPPLPTVTVSVLKPAGSTVYGNVGNCFLGSPAAVNSTMVSFTTVLRTRCRQRDGTGSLWAWTLEPGMSTSEYQAAALDLMSGDEMTIFTETPARRSVSVSVTEASSLFPTAVQTNLRPMRKGQPIARGFSSAGSTSAQPPPATYQIEDLAAADGQSMENEYFDPVIRWTQVIYLQTAVTNTMSIAGGELPLPVPLTLVTAGTPSVSWMHEVGTPLPDWIETGVFWTEASQFRAWRVMLRGGEQTTAIMPPTPEDLVDFRIGNGSNFDTGIMMWNFDVSLADGAAAWIGPWPTNFRLALTSKNRQLFAQ